MKVLIRLLIALIVLIVILAVAFVVVINLTPRQLKMQDVSIGGETLDELGIADTKIINIYKSIKNIGKAKESDVVDNPVNQEEDKQEAKNNFAGSTLDGKDDYTAAAKGHVIYPGTPKLVTYDDTTIAYILDNIIQHADAESSSEVKALKDANLSVKELTIGLKDGVGTLRVVTYMDLKNFESEIKNELGGAAGILPIPKYTYLVSDFTFTVGDVDGKMVTTSVGICVNGNNDDPVSKAILKVIGKMSGGEGIDSLNGKLGEAVAQVVSNLGRIGSSVLPLNIGMSGVQEHKLTLITHIA